MARRSESCRDRTGGLLWEYDSAREALRSRTPESLVIREVETYECEKCGKWHRRPADEGMKLPGDVMCLMCRSQSGMPKQSYPTVDDALAAAEELSKQREELAVYACPHGRGYHLTKG